jgi:hypothetical protein
MAARSRRGVSIFPGSIWCSTRAGQLSRHGAPATGGLTITRSRRSICAKWMPAPSSTSRRSACRRTDSTAIPADGSKPTGSRCRSSSIKAPSATNREKPVRRPESKSTKAISDAARSSGLCRMPNDLTRHDNSSWNQFYWEPIREYLRGATKPADFAQALAQPRR